MSSRHRLKVGSVFDREARIVCTLWNRYTTSTTFASVQTDATLERQVSMATITTITKTKGMNKHQL